jgi:hypothetical protein
VNLEYFKTSFYPALKVFFESFNIPINYLDDKPIPAKEVLSKTFKAHNEAYKLINDVYFLGSVDDKIFKGQATDIDLLKSTDYKGLLIFGVTLHPRGNGLLPTRTQMSEITRAFNREFNFNPVAVVFRYDKYISLAASERLKYKVDWKEGDKPGKVSILRDVDISNPHAGHLKILNELHIIRSGNKGINSFKALYEYWQQVFSTSVLNKKFYQELQTWYFWALKNTRFPNEPKKDDYKLEADYDEALKVHRGQNIIRLLTRLLFVWFIKEKKLISEDIFDAKYIADNFLDQLTTEKPEGIFKDVKSESKFYKVILQNLFFATLNQEIDKREFRKYKKNMNVTNLMRYEKHFKSGGAQKFLHLMRSSVPFMNGGLFECLDKPHPKKRGPRGGDVIIYTDGFSDKDDNVLLVPDYLFFDHDEEVDISEDVGSDKNVNKHAKTRGLLKILKSYKFTIAENTPIEVDVALDPELLGKVFENLLASYNPETKTTARKQSGSFYTPREIVDYMVDESLIDYLKTAIIWDGEEEVDKDLHSLLSYGTSNPYVKNEKIVWKIINALDKCKILDPACGSGAFPMGALQKMVHVLQKLDTDNEKWRELQMDKALEKSKAVFKLDDKEKRESYLKDINDTFDQQVNDSDYARKLYLLENCIYGVDIQPVATQISKLRFFISLVVDQKVNTDKYNFGIRPLPNLEIKFVTANTLIGIEKPESQLNLNLFSGNEILELEREIKNIRHNLFNEKTPDEKRKLRQEDKKLRQKMAELLENNGLGSKSAEQLALWNPYDPNASSPFFDPEWMFDVQNGFDIVIGNPPYVDSESMVKNNPEFRNILKDMFSSARGNWDLFVVFIECSIILTKHHGVMSLIVPNKLISAKYTVALRNILLTYQIKELADYSCVNVFEEVDVYPVVIRVGCAKTLDKPYVRTKLMYDLLTEKDSFLVSPEVFYKDIFWDKYFFPKDVIKVIVEISKHKSLREYDFKLRGAATVNEAYQIKEYLCEWQPSMRDSYYFINTGTIDPFQSLWGIKKTKYIKDFYEKPAILESDLLQVSPNRVTQSNLPKIIVAGMARKIEAFYDSGKFLAGKSTSIITGDIQYLKALNAFLNSTIASFWLTKNYNSLSMAGGYLNVGVNELSSIPVPEIVFLEYLYVFQFLDILLEYSVGHSRYVVLKIILDYVAIEVFYLEHMKTQNANILEFIEGDISEILQNKEFENLNDNEKEQVIAKLHETWTDPNNEVVKCMSQFREKSPDILKVILDN